MNLEDKAKAVEKMLEYLALSAEAIDAVWEEYGDKLEEEETKGLEAVWEEHPKADESNALTVEELEDALKEMAEGFQHWHPLTSSPYPDDGYQKVKGLKDTMPNIFSMKTEHMAMCPLDDDVCSSMENAHPWPIADIIIHLNDEHQWARRDIADWLDTLDVDLTFEVPEGGDE